MLPRGSITKRRVRKAVRVSILISSSSNSLVDYFVLHFGAVERFSSVVLDLRNIQRGKARSVAIFYKKSSLVKASLIPRMARVCV
jgi:hypothetical protein